MTLHGVLNQRCASEASLANRDKTRVIDLKQPGEKLNFLGYLFRYERDRKGRQQRYLNVTISEKALKREWQKLYEMISKERCFGPLPKLIDHARVLRDACRVRANLRARKYSL
jgi:hypothetical protein